MNNTIHIILDNGSSRVTFEPRPQDAIVLVHEEHLDNVLDPVDTGVAMHIEDARSYYKSLREKGYIQL